MSKLEQYDVIIIGSGQGGKPLASAFAAAGKKTAIIERNLIGGTCVNVGCFPTKTMVASARIAYLARRGAEYGVRIGSVEIDMPQVLARKKSVVEFARGLNVQNLEGSKGLDIFMGEAGFIDPKTVEIRLNSGGTRRLKADTICINTGNRPALAKFEGIRDVPYLDSTSILDLDRVPEHLLIIGGGDVGLEFSQIFRRFGSQVTIIQRGKQLLSQEDADIAEELRTVLSEDGIEILLETSVHKVARSADGQISVTVNSPEGQKVVTGSHLLVAIGRVPVTDGLHLEVAGVQVELVLSTCS